MYSKTILNIGQKGLFRIWRFELSVIGQNITNHAEISHVGSLITDFQGWLFSNVGNRPKLWSWPLVTGACWPPDTAGVPQGYSPTDPTWPGGVHGGYVGDDTCLLHAPINSTDARWGCSQRIVKAGPFLVMSCCCRLVTKLISKVLPSKWYQGVPQDVPRHQAVDVPKYERRGVICLTPTPTPPHPPCMRGNISKRSFNVDNALCSLHTYHVFWFYSFFSGGNAQPLHMVLSA